MVIDLRSDTVTRPDNEMLQAMHDAEVGDDVFGDDPTVIDLESEAAEMFGKGAALFLPSGTQSNLAALLTHCNRGEEYIVGQEAHTYLFEGGGGACLGGIQPQPLNQEQDGTLDLNKVVSLIKPDDYHYARTRLLCLENTTWGKVMPETYLKEVKSLAEERSLGLHLDGARIFNASVQENVPVSKIASYFDSVSICLSKGLGAPVGSILLGDIEFITQARRWRKMLGGGMRQSGILAAAGLYALKNNVIRLIEDHANAHKLANSLGSIDGIDAEPAYTNMVFVSVQEEKRQGLIEYLNKNNVLVTGFIGSRLRLVTHKDVNEAAIDKAINYFADYFSP